MLSIFALHFPPDAELTILFVACSSNAELSIIIAFCPPVSAISGTIAHFLAAKVLLMVLSTSVEPVKQTPSNSVVR